MADERGYSRQLRPQPGAVAGPVSPDAFGAGVGRAIENAGQIVHSEEIEDARIARDIRDNSEWSRYQVAYAQSREEFERLAADSRESDDPGHARALAESWAVRESELVGMLTSERLKERARGSLAEWGGNYRTREALWEQTRQAEIAVDRYQEQLGISEGRTRRLENVGDYEAELKVQMDAIGGLAVSDKIRDGLIEDTEQRLAVAFVRGMTDRDPVAAKALLDSGGFDGVLTGDQVEALRNGSEVEIRRAAAAEARAKAEQVAAVREQISYFKERQGNGFFDEEPEVYDGAIAAAAAIRDPVLVEQLTDLQAGAAFGRIWGPRNANSVQRQQRIAELRGKERLNDAETRELKFLQDNAPGWADRERSDPVGQLLEQGALGGVMLDPADPDSFAARARSVEARFPGQNVSPLSREEGAMLGRMFDSGAAGREEALNLLAQFPPGQAMAAARMMDPEDRSLPVIATMNQRRRTTALRGREILANDSKFLEARMRDGALDMAEEMLGAQEQFNAALRAVPFDQRVSIERAAQEYLAGTLERTGAKWSGGDYLAAINRVLGAQGSGEDQRGGISEWGGRAFLLPDGATKREFVDFAVRDARLGEDPAVNPDGSFANLSRATPVRVGPNLYQFHTGTNPIRTKSGEIYTVQFKQGDWGDALRVLRGGQ